MGKLLQAYVKEQREARGLRPVEVARLMVYRNISKGCRRVEEFERFGAVYGDFFDKLGAVLELDPEKVLALAEADELQERENFEKWVNEPVPMEMILSMSWNWFAQVQVVLPDHVKTEEHLVAYGQALARHKEKKVRCYPNRRWTIYVNEKGEVTDRRETKFKESSVWLLRAGGGPFHIVTKGEKIDHFSTGEF